MITYTHQRATYLYPILPFSTIFSYSHHVLSVLDKGGSDELKEYALRGLASEKGVEWTRSSYDMLVTNHNEGGAGRSRSLAPTAAIYQIVWIIQYRGILLTEEFNTTGNTWEGPSPCLGLWMSQATRRKGRNTG